MTRAAAIDWIAASPALAAASSGYSQMPMVTARRPTGSASPASERPIDAAAATELVARMKALPRADVDAILAELGVQRVRELKGAQIARAKAVLAKFEGEPSSQAEVDPFA